MRLVVPGRLILLAVATLVVAVLSLPDVAHAHAEQSHAAQSVQLDIHSDETESSGLGHCHGEASCSSGLHIVFGIPAVMPDRPQSPALDRAATIFDDTNLGREPPVPIALL